MQQAAIKVTKAIKGNCISIPEDKEEEHLAKCVVAHGGMVMMMTGNAFRSSTLFRSYNNISRRYASITLTSPTTGEKNKAQP